MTCCADMLAATSKDTVLPRRVRAGLDLGSRQVKLCVAGPQGVLRRESFEAVPFWLSLRKNGLDRAALGLEEDWPLVTTGYGRAALDGTRGISEVRAHFRGALAQTGLKDFTLVELGGQDSKVLQVSGGKVLDFLTNDRCAAGTGRYLENMARLLGVGLTELSAAHAQPAEITGTCAIFGETEILAHLAGGASMDSIMAGVNNSVARRIAQMVRRYHPPILVFCGGVAQNRALVKMAGDALGCEVLVPPEPQFNGAWGCCLEDEEL